MNKTEKLCRFCLKEINYSCHGNLEKPLWDILNVLNIKMNLGKAEEPTVCVGCTENLQKLYNFKATCAETEDRLTPFVSSQYGVRIDLPQVYLQVNEYGNLRDKNVCRFCMCETLNDISLQLNAVVEVIPSIKNLLETFFPEMDINLVRDPIICKICHGLLQDYLTFTRSCVSMEENVQNYIKAEGVNKEEKLDLWRLRQFLDTTIIKKEVDKVDAVKYETWQNELKFMGDPSFHVDVKSENVRHTEDLQFCVKNENIELTPIVNNSESILDIASADRGSKEKSGSECLYETNFTINVTGSKCSYTAKQKSSLGRYETIHNYPSETKMYKCENENCFYETKHKCALIQHALVHKSNSEVRMYRCEYEGCAFETKRKHNLKSHCLSHKTAWEVVMYKCEIEECSYETKRRASLARHKLKHKDQSEVTMYQCANENCCYATKHKKDLAKHRIVHKNPSEVIMYKCENENCSFITKYLSAIKQHMLVHKNASEVVMYKCDYETCTFETKLKHNLKTHMLIHKSSSEGPMYKCDIKDCSFETRYKRTLNNHKLNHGDLSGRNVYKCGFENCPFETKRKSSFTKHKSNHKDPSEVTMCKCENSHCLCETKNKFFKDIMYRCEYEGCAFKTKLKHNLKSHSLSHKSTSEVPMCKCDVKGCSYKTKYKSNLNKHKLYHNKDPSKIKVYKCNVEDCFYETKTKSSLTSHKLIHEDPTKVIISPQVGEYSFEMKYREYLVKQINTERSFGSNNVQL